MKIVVNREKFVEAFAVASGFAPTRSPKEVLMNIRCRVFGDKVTLMATDLESGISLDLEPGAAELLHAGDVLLNKERCGAIFREVSGDTFLIETHDHLVTIQTDNGRFELPTQNADEFPMPKQWDDEKCDATISTKLLRELIQRTVFCCDTETTRYALGGVRFEIAKGGEIVAVGTDGRRLAVQKGSCNSVKESSGIVPAKQAGLIARVINGEECKIAIGNNDILVKCDRATVYSRLVEGRYPNWTQVIPRNESYKRALVTCGPFASCVRQAAIVSEVESRGVLFRFSKEECSMRSETADVGKSNIRTPISFSDDESVEAQLDHRYVSDFMRVVPPESKVELRITTAQEPIMAVTQDGYSYVIMPMARS